MLGIDKRKVGKVIAKTGFCLTFAQLLCRAAIWLCRQCLGRGQQHVRNYFHQIDVHVDTTPALSGPRCRGF